MNSVGNHAKHQLNIVSALNSEAKCMIDCYRLKKISDSPFSVFSGDVNFDDKSNESVAITVLISGIGSLNMASAVGWLAAHQMNARSAWLNLGIAGHGQLDIGSGFIVTASYDALTDKVYYPPQVVRRPVLSSPCLSVNAPSGDYPNSGGLDMEVSSFFHSATRFCDAECVQSYKVVSDNPNQGIEHLNAPFIQQLMQSHVKTVHRFLNGLFTLLKTKPYVSQSVLVPAVKATHSQAQQMKKLAIQLGHTLNSHEVDELNQRLQPLLKTDAVLRALQAALHDYQPTLISNTGMSKTGTGETK